jgi:hypothetical protein
VRAVAADVARLADPDPNVRDAAATRIRAALAKEPEANGDPGQAHWQAALARIPKGISAAELSRRLGATTQGGASSGQSSSLIFRLDDHWQVVVYFDIPDRLREVGPLSRGVRHVWVQPPGGYTGRWVTYFVSGATSHDIDYEKGTYKRFTAFHDNGQKAYEQRYVNGKIDGPEVGYHANGTSATHWYEDGKLQSEQHYVNGELDGSSIQYREDGTPSSRIDYRAGKETGQAAWDEQGKLLYARGTATAAKPVIP